MPTMTLSLTTIGADVIVSPFFGSPFLTLQTSLPVLASSATTCRIGLVEDDLAVAIGDAAVDRVAAHHRDDRRILLRLVLPEDLAVVVEIEREDVVRERRAARYITSPMTSGAAFMAAQHAGRECPDRTQILDVVLVDLLELAVAVIGVIAGRHDPLVWVFFELDQLVIRRSGPDRQCQDRPRESAGPTFHCSLRGSDTHRQNCRQTPRLMRPSPLRGSTAF